MIKKIVLFLNVLTTVIAINAGSYQPFVASVLYDGASMSTYQRPEKKLEGLLQNTKSFATNDGRIFVIDMQNCRYMSSMKASKYNTTARCSDGNTYEVKIKHIMPNNIVAVTLVNEDMCKRYDIIHLVKKQQVLDIFAHAEGRRKLREGLQAALVCTENTANSMLAKLSLGSKSKAPIEPELIELVRRNGSLLSVRYN